jgi:hypothetical protein
MSALGQKRTYAAQQVMFALPLIATGVFTISDAGLFLKWLFFAPGDCLLLLMLVAPTAKHHPMVHRHTPRGSRYDKPPYTSTEEELEFYRRYASGPMTIVRGPVGAQRVRPQEERPQPSKPAQDE